MGKKLALGKGIASLLQETPNQILRSNLSDFDSSITQADKQVNDSGEINNNYSTGNALLSVDKINTNPDQPRKIFDEIKLEELADSIKENGILQPLIVTKNEDKLELVAGERRLRAAKIAGLKEVPVIYKRTTEKEKMVYAILENVQRDDLNCVEEALAYYRLISELKLTQEEVAKKLGKSRASISNLLRILKLPRLVIDMMQKDEISLGHGKVLLSVDSEDLILTYAKRSVEDQLSVRELERIIKAREQFKPNEKVNDTNSSVLNEKLRQLETNLESKLGARIRLNYKGSSKKGKIEIPYKSLDEFNALYDFLMHS
jgi:ParB family transcriptional regulator, chromosome partitioning protein